MKKRLFYGILFMLFQFISYNNSLVVAKTKPSETPILRCSGGYCFRKGAEKGQIIKFL